MKSAKATLNPRILLNNEICQSDARRSSCKTAICETHSRRVLRPSGAPRRHREWRNLCKSLATSSRGIGGPERGQRPFLRPSINKGRSTNFSASLRQIEGSKGSITFSAFFVNKDSSFAANTAPRINRLCFSAAWGIYFFIIPSL